MKTVVTILGMLSSIAPCNAQDAKPSKEIAPNISNLDGLWLLAGPQSNNAFLLEIKAGSIKGRAVKLDELPLPDTLRRWAFIGKIKSLTASAIELQLREEELNAEWTMSSGVYSFELLKKPSSPAFMWIDFLHRPELKDAGFYFHKLELPPVPQR